LPQKKIKKIIAITLISLILCSCTVTALHTINQNVPKTIINHGNQSKNPTDIEIEFIHPQNNTFYLGNTPLFNISNNTIIYGSHTIIVNATSPHGITKVEFYINGQKEHTDNTSNYTFQWRPIRSFRHTIKAIAYDNNNSNASIELSVFKWRLHPVLILVAGFFIIRRIMFPL
jgi:hypothetical protein